MDAAIVKKYIVDIGEQELSLPLGSQLLSVSFQDSGDLCLWVLEYPNARKVRRTVLVVRTEQSTGQLFMSSFKFIGNAQSVSGLVLHAFEVFNLPAEEASPFER